jgi:hypothetical protein
MEERFGVDFSRVRVHVDDGAARSVSAVHALAYTVGNHIVFSKGSYSPHTVEGQKLLAHELVHTIQQGTSSHGSLRMIPEDSPLEREADRISNWVLNDSRPNAEPSPTFAGEEHGADARRASPRTWGPIRTVTSIASTACAREVDETMPETGEGAEVTPGTKPETGEGAEVTPATDGDLTQLSSFSGGGGSGTPSPNIPDCSAWMGGRQVEHWFAGSIMGANHTYINFKEDKSKYWLVEAGPLPGDPKHVGAWAKDGQWENRGLRVGTQYNTPEKCASAKAALFSAQSTYHSMVLPYDPSKGPNSNSFTEHMIFKAPIFAIFTPFDWKWDYWKSHTRPF